jgi:predicted Zn-dependent protease
MARTRKKTKGPRPAGPPGAAARRRIWAIALPLLIVPALGGGYFLWRAGQVTADRSKALQLAKQGEFAAAEPLLLAAWRNGPRDTELAEALVLGYVGGDEPAKAEPFADHWCDLQPNDPRPRRVRLELLLGQQKSAEALTAAEKVLEVAPADEAAQRHVVTLLLEAGRYGEAEKACRRFLEGNPGHAGLLYRLAEACYYQGRPAEAERLLDDLLRSQPGYPAPLVLRAVLYCEAGQAGQAIPLLRQAIARDPYSSRAYYHLGRALSRSGQTAEGERAMAEFLRLSAAERLLRDVDFQPDNLDLQVRGARLLLDRGKGEEAGRLLRRVLARDPNHQEAQRLWATRASPRGGNGNSAR